ncbi:MAG: short-chain dehydrogenase [Frondihabitans sp.]|nr:short-chain dehydrogenase [Frondihabitans sp.]
MTLIDSRIVIIGGTSGIGLATAEAAAAAGAAVIVASSRQSSVDAALEHLPQGATGHVLDVTDPDALQAFFDRVGQFDHLVFTAGENLTFMSLADYDIEQARKFLEIRFFRALEAIHLALPFLSDHGSITLTSGTAGLRPGPGAAVVAAACNAMIAACKSLAVELAPVRVNVVVPGIVRSPLWAAMSNEEQEALYQQSASTMPVGRVGEPSDIAKAYVYLIDQDYATGTTTVVDGGGILV